MYSRPLYRNQNVQKWIEKIDESEGSLEEFSKAYQVYGIQFQPDNTVKVREWAPGAEAVYLTGDFSRFPLHSFYL